MTKDAVLRTGDHELELDLVESAEGNEGLRIGNLLKETGQVTYDPGFANTASLSSAITYIDGDEGILRYRGYDIAELTEKSTFVEVSYLLIYGELPTPQQFGCLRRASARAHAPARGYAPLLPGLPVRRASHADGVVRDRRDVDVLPRRPRSPMKRRSTSPPHVCWRRCRRSQRSPTATRRVSRSCSRTTAWGSWRTSSA